MYFIQTIDFTITCSRNHIAPLMSLTIVKIVAAMSEGSAKPVDAFD